MRIDFAAYADDCTVSGGVALETDRLSDMIGATEEFQVDGAAFRALDDGRVIEAGDTAICLDDLCVITATGPRGKQERRLWTRQVPVCARIGPYSVVGYLHSPPTIDPFKRAERRAIVALTAATIEYTMEGVVAREHSDAVLLNRRKIERMELANKAEVQLSRGLDLKTTGDLFG
ncbi:MAG: hypothetical protein ABIZ52_06920 [Candidatus Limnocylindrales bacterium]